MLTLTLIGVGIAIWFGRTAGRLGHGFARALLWSVVGFFLFLGPLLGVGWVYDLLRTYTSVPESAPRSLVAVSRVLAVFLPILVRKEILMKTGVPNLSVLQDESTSVRPGPL
jgi:hypothetical protein